MSSLFLQLIQPFPSLDFANREEEEISGIRALGIKYGVFPLIYGRLLQYAKQFPERKDIRDFLEASENAYLTNAARSVQQEAAEKKVISLLAENAIPSLVIKGNQIARDVYHDPNSRVSSDIDILVRRQNAIKADKLLSASGYISEADTPLIYCMSRFHHASYRHPEHDFPIEMHWNFGIPYLFFLSSEKIWRDGILMDHERTRLSSEMILIMLLVHHHSHAFRDLRIITDILWTLYRYEDSINWHQFALKIRETGLVKTTLISLHQIKTLWEAISEKMCSFQTLEEEMKKTVYDVPKILLSYFQVDIHSERLTNIYKDKFMARFALDKRSDMLLSFPKTIFPVPDAIRELYRDRRNWTLPYNYVKFIKWRMKDWTGLGRNAKTPV
jgi:hypothetical protein